MTQKYTQSSTSKKVEAVSNNNDKNDNFSKEETEKIFNTGNNDKTKSKINYYIGDEDMEGVDQEKVVEKGIVTVKRHLDNARNSDYNEPASKKKTKKY